MQLKQIYRSGRVLRYHANPEMSQIGQNNADHQWGALTLLLCLHPLPPLRLIKAVQFHDAAELIVGDLPYPFKLSSPELAEKHAEIEAQELENLGVGGIYLTEYDKQWLKFVDRLESHMLVSLYRPDRLETPGWKPQTEQILATAENLGVLKQVKEIM